VQKEILIIGGGIAGLAAGCYARMERLAIPTTFKINSAKLPPNMYP